MERALSGQDCPTSIIHALKLVVAKLEKYELSWREMTETVAEAQRHIAELEAYTAYRRDIESKWKSDSPYSAPVVQSRLGGFTESAYVARVFFILGIPVWFLHRSKEGLDEAKRSFHAVFPMDYLELGKWPSDTVHTTSSNAAMLSDLSSSRSWPPTHTLVPASLNPRDARPRSRSRSRSPPRPSTSSSFQQRPQSRGRVCPLATKWSS